MTPICVPASYTCNGCWQVEWPRCKGNARGYESADTYDKALAIANDRIKNYESCKGTMGLDYNDYRIFISGGDYCSQPKNQTSNSSDGGNAVHSEGTSSNPATSTKRPNNQGELNGNANMVAQLKQTFFTTSYTRALSKLNSLKQANPSKAQYLNDKYWPKINYYEQIFLKEFEKGENASAAMLRQYTKELDNFVETMTLTAAETEANTTTQRQQFQNQANHFLNQAQSPQQSSILQSLNLDLARTNAFMAGNQEQVQQIQQLQNQQREEANQQLFTTLQSGIQNIMGILAQNAERKAQEQRRQFEAAQLRRQQRLQAQLDEERRRQEEEARINAEMLRQFSIDSLVLASNNIGLKPSAIGASVDSVYYIGYQRPYDEQELKPLLLKVFVVYRYNDGTFPLFSTVVERSNFENNIDRYGITLLLGFFPKPGRRFTRT